MNVKAIVEKVAEDLYVNALKKLPPDIKYLIKESFSKESNKRAKGILGIIFKNIEVAEKTDTFICQDTGLPLYFVEIGKDFPLYFLDIEKAIRLGCKSATIKYNIRPNVVNPITRNNSRTNVGDKIPAIEYFWKEKEDSLKITMVPKGSGSENQSLLKMLLPTAGIAGIKNFVLESVVKAGANPCPPVIVGVGIGGTFDLCADLAKRAAVLPATNNKEKSLLTLEKELLKQINSFGIGPMGLGGDTTALRVTISSADTHITTLPVAVNIQCWAARRATAKIYRIKDDKEYKYTLE